MVEAAHPFSATVARDREVIAVDSMPAEPPASAPRPRLDHVVTLGETTYEPYNPAASAPAGNGGVVINNNITVNGSDPGYYGGYGYGGYYGGSSYGYGARGTARGRGTTTRAVGGNWPTIPSYGPRQMR